ncbi:MAG: hypothetical protein FWH21_04455, partial [Kiritimatiellaeota bacterium]|nr:hypothetical protein [Kiritimatiellota bacterium]
MNTFKFMWRLALVSAVTLTARGGVEVRVRQTQGGPRIHVDGAPVAPRFFFGVERSGKIRLEQEWKTYSFDISPE